MSVSRQHSQGQRSSSDKDTCAFDCKLCDSYLSSGRLEKVKSGICRRNTRILDEYLTTRNTNRGTNTNANRAQSGDKAPQTMLQFCVSASLSLSLSLWPNIKSPQIFNCQISVCWPRSDRIAAMTMATHRNRFTASAHTHLGVQALPAVVELTDQPPIRVHDAEASDVNGAKFDYLALPAIVHDLQCKTMEWKLG